jgi:hypothetical protein
VDNPAFDMSAEEKKSDNLELVDLTPPKISAKDSDKIDVEKGADQGAFGEQFVSVNRQEKNGIRGKKLIVTQDNNRKKSGSKKSCWMLLLGILIVAGVVIAVLVGCK